jgi:hypothetical protein
LTREVKIQNTVFTLLTQQLEEAKIAEARDMPKVQIIDPAVPAEMKSRPRIRLILVITAFASVLFGMFACFLLECVERLKEQYRSRLAQPAIEEGDPRADTEAQRVAQGNGGSPETPAHHVLSRAPGAPPESSR